MKKISRPLNIFLLFCTFILAFLLGRFFFQIDKQQTLSVGLKWLNQAQFAGMYVAKDKGFYANSGIDVKLIERDVSKASVINQVADGSIDIGVVSTGDFLKALDSDRDVIALGAYFQNTPAAIVTLQKSGIRSARELKGKTIGMLVNSKESEMLTKQIVNKAGVSVDNIKFKAVGYDLETALINGDVDAISVYRTSNLFQLEENNINYNLILPESYGVYIYDDILVTSRKFFIDNRKIIERFMKATNLGWEFTLANSKEAVDIVLKYDNERYHDFFKEDFILKNSLPLMKSKYEKMFGLMSYKKWENIYSMFYEAKLISKFNIDQYIVQNYSLSF